MRMMVQALAVALVLRAAVPVAAHHAFSLEYDATKPRTFEGVVTKIEWTNPHVRIYVDVIGGGGKVNNWNLELASLSALVRNGWTRDSVKVGEKVKVEGYEGRGTNTFRLNATSITTGDGGQLFSGAAGEDGRPVTPGAPAR